MGLSKSWLSSLPLQHVISTGWLHCSTFITITSTCDINWLAPLQYFHHYHFNMWYQLVGSIVVLSSLPLQHVISTGWLHCSTFITTTSTCDINWLAPLQYFHHYHFNMWYQLAGSIAVLSSLPLQHVISTGWLHCSTFITTTSTCDINWLAPLQYFHHYHFNMWYQLVGSIAVLSSLPLQHVISTGWLHCSTFITTTSTCDINWLAPLQYFRHYHFNMWYQLVGSIAVLSSLSLQHVISTGWLHCSTYVTITSTCDINWLAPLQYFHHYHFNMWYQLVGSNAVLSSLSLQHVISTGWLQCSTFITITSTCDINWLAPLKSWPFQQVMPVTVCGAKCWRWGAGDVKVEGRGGGGGGGGGFAIMLVKEHTLLHTSSELSNLPELLKAVEIMAVKWIINL